MGGCLKIVKCATANEIVLIQGYVTDHAEGCPYWIMIEDTKNKVFPTGVEVIPTAVRYEERVKR